MTEGSRAAPAVWPLRALPEAPARELLWRDSRVLEAAASHSAQVLAAICRALGERGEAAAFLAQARRLVLDRLDAKVAPDPVWTDARAYRWTRTAHALLGAGEPARLAAQLDAFGMFALGAAVRDRGPLALERPLALQLPFSLPGTQLVLDGEGTLLVDGVADGVIRARAPVALVPVPVAAHREAMLPLDPHALDAPGLGFAAPALSAGLGYQRREARLVSSALAAMRAFAPDCFAVFARIIRRAALKPAAAGDYDDWSEPELPGTFVASVTRHPLVMADHFIHELQHNRLSLLEEHGALFQDGGQAPSHYSPWRDKPRGLYGIYHGVFVFIAVHGFWRAVFAAPDAGLAEGLDRVSGPDRAYAVDRLLRLPRQLALATGVLRRSARLTALGASILDVLAEDVAAIVATPPAGLPDDAPAVEIDEHGRLRPETGGGAPMSVRRAIAEHLRRYDLARECDGLLGEAA